jgi:hypothetical protein
MKATLPDFGHDTEYGSFMVDAASIEFKQTGTVANLMHGLVVVVLRPLVSTGFMFRCKVFLLHREFAPAPAEEDICASCELFCAGLPSQLTGTQGKSMCQTDVSLPGLIPQVGGRPWGGRSTCHQPGVCPGGGALDLGNPPRGTDHVLPAASPVHNYATTCRTGIIQDAASSLFRRYARNLIALRRYGRTVAPCLLIPSGRCG